MGAPPAANTSTDTDTYDKAGHQLTSTNGSGSVTYTYDALWRVTQEQHKDTSGTVTSTTTYAYDINGHLPPPTAPASRPATSPTLTISWGG